MRKMVSFAIVVLLMLSCGGIVWSEVLLDETFTVDLSNWTKLDTPGASGTVDIELSGYGEVTIGMTNNDRFRYQGLMSKDRFTVSTDKMLVINYYGTNYSGSFWSSTGTQYQSQQSLPYWLVSATDRSAEGFVGGGTWNSAGLRGKNTSSPDLSYYNYQTTNGTYTDVGGATYGALKHVIVTIDDVNVKVYIEDDYFENLGAPVPVLSLPTASVYYPTQLTEIGLHVYLLAGRESSWYVDACGERFKGVKVSRVNKYIPADCAEAISSGYGLRGDVNGDCSVNLEDLFELIQSWLICVDPQDILCDRPWEI